MKICELPGDEDSGPTCRTYVFQNESHTLGNALKCIINRYEDVDFCGYTVPHPAESKMLFRIQTKETPALEVLKRGLNDLEKVCDHTIGLFEKEVKDFSSKLHSVYHLLREEYEFTKSVREPNCNLSHLRVNTRSYTAKAMPSTSSKFTSPMKKRKRDNKIEIDNFTADVVGSKKTCAMSKKLKKNINISNIK